MVTLKGNILIVDDEEMIRWILRRKLSKEGYNCDEADNADKALVKLRVSPSELVVLDINMPGKLGSEVLPEIKESFPETAVIMASGVTDTSVIAQCINKGAEDYICKPFSLNEVLLSVSRALEKRKLWLQILEFQRNLGKKSRKNPAVVREFFLDAIETLVGELEANDKYTMGHSRRVTKTALAIGKKLSLTSDELDDLRWGALLHDVGKIAIDSRILNKPDKLTTEEYSYIMTHAIIGPSLVKPLVNDNVVKTILHHHDHYDGSGFDQAMTGGDIPLGGRIVALADAFDAMLSDRPYRAAMSRKEALDEVTRHSGTQFDPTVSSAFLKIAANEAMPLYR